MGVGEMMLKRVVKCLAVGLMLQGVASAGHCEANYWFSGEALLLRASGFYPYAAVLNTTSVGGVRGRQFAVCPSYRWGFKLEAGYSCCNTEYLVNWLSYNSGDNNKKMTFDGNLVKEVSAVLLVAFVPDLQDPGAFGIQNGINYDALDGEAAYWICPECSRFAFRLFGGLRYANIDRIQRLFVRSQQDAFAGFTRQKSHMRGVGPRLGLGAITDFVCSTRLSGSVAGHVLIGSMDSSYYDDGLSTIVGQRIVNDVKNDRVCRFIPGLELKLGLGRDFCVCDWAGFAEVGYQITHYLYGSQSTFMLPTGESSNWVHTDPVTFDGFSFRLQLKI